MGAKEMGAGASLDSVVARIRTRNEEHARAEGFVDDPRRAPSDRRERLVFAAGLVRGVKVRLDRMRAAGGDDDPVLEVLEELRRALDVLTADVLLQVRS